MAVATLGFAPVGEPALRREFQCTAFLNGMNHNKFWRVEVWPNGSHQVLLRVTFGRVGSGGSVSEKASSMSAVESLIQSKLYPPRGKEPYHEIALHNPLDVVVPATTTAVAPKSEDKVAQLVEWIYQEAGSYINDYLQGGTAALDHLSRRQIEEGRHQLDVIRSMAGKNQNWVALGQAVQDYFNLIPTKIPARPDPQQVVSGFIREIGEQEDRLNQLEAAVATLKRTQGGFSLYDSLGAQIERLRWSSDEHKKLVQWINETSIHGWRPKIRDIFQVTIPFERERFEKSKTGKGKTVQLFHGTRNPNIRHILQQGLRIPKSMSNGWMFGAGIYTANKFTKSGNYCRPVKVGVPSMALIVDVALGKSFVAEGGRQFTQAPQGFDSVMGKAGKTRLGSSSNLMNDEFIVYNESQVTVRYLVAFDGGPRGF